MAVIEKKKSMNNGVDQEVMNQRAQEFREVATEEIPASAVKNDKVFTIRTTTEKQIEYKTFFASKGLSVSKGVQIAIDYLMDQVRKGNVELKNTGIFTR